jgi:hypothetical protein
VSGQPVGVLDEEAWPYSSPDCNLLDWSRSVCERDENKASYITAASLMVKMMDMANFPRDILVKACRRFRQQTEAEVEAGSNCFS